MKPEITAYIATLPDWQQAICSELRAAIHGADPDIEESIKWGTPAFGHKGPVAWMFCARDWVHFSFPQGALPAETHGLFEPTENKAGRTIKLHQDQAVPRGIIEQLVQQAVANNQAGKKVDLQIPKPGERKFDIPHEYLAFLKENGAYEEYLQRPYYQQKGWIQWIEEAKQQATRDKRRRTMLEELSASTYMPPKAPNH